MAGGESMKSFSIRLLITLLTFSIGVSSTAVWFFRPSKPVNTQPMKSVEVGVVKPDASPPLTDPCSFTRKGRQRLSAFEAVQLAECFIVQNGYTDLPPLEDKSKLTPESVWPGTDEHGMEMRHDSLERQAHGYVAGVRYPGGWAGVFRCKYKARFAEVVTDYAESLEKVGRFVTMDSYGNRMRVEHQDFYLNHPALVRLEH